MHYTYLIDLYESFLLVWLLGTANFGLAMYSFGSLLG